MLNQEAHPAHDCGMANIQRFNNILARFPLPEEPDSTKARANVFRRRFVPEFVKKLRIRRQFCELVGNLVWFSHHPTFYGRLSGHASGRHDSRAYRICQIYLGREMRDDAERAKLHVDICERNHALLNRQPEQATVKREQQAGAGTYRHDASGLRMAHARPSGCACLRAAGPQKSFSKRLIRVDSSVSDHDRRYYSYDSNSSIGLPEGSSSRICSMPI